MAHAFSSLDVIPAGTPAIQYVAEHHTAKRIRFAVQDGLSAKVRQSGLYLDALTARAMWLVRGALRPDLQQKFDRMVTTPAGFLKLADFAMKRVA